MATKKSVSKKVVEKARKIVNSAAGKARWAKTPKKEVKKAMSELGKKSAAKRKAKPVGKSKK